MDREFLNNHYAIILENNRDKILSGGTGDELLYNVKTDGRMALVLLIRIPSEITRRIGECISELKDIEPDLYYYPEEDMHITVMDILGGKEGRLIPDSLEEYKRTIEECAKEIEPFTITFDGLVASDNAVMVKGFYDEALLKFRESLRDSFAEKGLLLEERYKTISSHITITRLYDKYRDPERFLEYVERPHSFGTMTVTSMELAFHNWYDTRKELLSRVVL